MWHVLPMMNWLLSDHQTIKLDMHRSILSLPNGSRRHVIRPSQALRAQLSHMKKCPKCPWSSLLLHCLLSLLACTHGLMGSSLQSMDRGREDSGLVYKWFFIIFKHNLKVDSFSPSTVHWASMDSGEEKASTWEELWAVHLVVLLLWKEKWLDAR